MTDIKGFNVSGQKITPNTYGIYEREKYTGSITGLEASQNSTPDMNVLIQVGTALLTKNTNSSVVAVLDAPTSIAIATADTSNPRIDTIVVYEDLSVTMPTEEPYSIDAVGRFKIVSIAGTPATSPSAPNDATIQSAIGGTNTSWTRICTVRVEANTTTIIDSKIDNTVKLPLGSIIADGTVTASKINTTTFDKTWTNITTFSTGWSNYGAPFGTASYYKDPLTNIVYLAGLVQVGAGAGTSILTLPSGFRPVAAELFVVNNGGVAGTINIQNTGVITKENGPNDFVSLGGVFFKTA